MTQTAKKYKVFIDGQAGTTGLQLADRLALREDILLLAVEESLRKDETEKARLMNMADVVFLCLPDEAARQAVTLVTNPHTVIIDASTAHRTESGWAYGFAELSAQHRAALKRAKRIAVPGCHASGAISLLYPLISMGIASADYPFTITSLTGYSGGGKKMIADYEAGGKELAAPTPYATAQKHKHLPEITKVCALAYPPVFVPIVDDYYQGMAVIVPLYTRLLKQHVTPEMLRALYESYYAGQHFVRVTGGGSISPLENVGTNYLTIRVEGNEERIVLYACLDNLGKGASGSAVQAMNIALGLSEDKGLN